MTYIEFGPNSKAHYPKSYLRKATWLKVDPKSAARAYQGVNSKGFSRPAASENSIFNTKSSVGKEFQTHLQRTKGFD